MFSIDINILGKLPLWYCWRFSIELVKGLKGIELSLSIQLNFNAEPEKSLGKSNAEIWKTLGKDLKLKKLWEVGDGDEWRVHRKGRGCKGRKLTSPKPDIFSWGGMSNVKTWKPLGQGDKRGNVSFLFWFWS